MKLADIFLIYFLRYFYRDSLDQSGLVKHEVNFKRNYILFLLNVARLSSSIFRLINGINAEHKPWYVHRGGGSIMSTLHILTGASVISG